MVMIIPLLVIIATIFGLLIGFSIESAIKKKCKFHLPRFIAGMIGLIISVMCGFNLHATTIIMGVCIFGYYLFIELTGFEEKFKEGYYHG